jgi:hypothetical protein
MIRKPKMKLWLKNLDIENCINCIKGKESGKITLSSNYKKSQKRTNASVHSENKEDLKKDWKNLYRR